MRKASTEALNKLVAHDLDEYMVSDALVLARDGLKNALAWETPLHQASASTMISCLYRDHAVSPDSRAILRTCSQDQLEGEVDPRIVFINTFLEALTTAIAPGAHWVCARSRVTSDKLE